MTACSVAPSLPFEVFLNVVDILILEAEVAAEPMDLCFYLSSRSEPESQLDVQVTDLFSNPRWTLRNRKRRFQQLRLALQVNSKTRGMALRKFPRITLWDSYSKKASPLWVHPKTDLFNPILCTMPSDCIQFRQALQYPLAQDRVLVQSLVNIQGFPRDFLMEEYEADVDSILALPNIKEITLNSEVVITSASYRYPEIDHPHPSDELIPLSGYFFPTIGRWTGWHRQALEYFCWRAEERGIKVFVGMGGSAERRKLELVPTADGLRSRLINPICTCDI
ncbi:hypothetical protein GCG54_00004351 [Colletotrichum gloeosporioides]|uniref:Uncharacterized protein n=1 Tax=Colletotrichum gloeosporioides TaxID=474922 RepID=A0A8H4CLL3_COLGL|nr:uncharacterized protein GCG54_00004351 [Colletotrichum gloeosporioides]KAF3806026.1 hypothetical protein GCG54_00004351 [Colletotrichum gloeosporioides]